MREEKKPLVTIMVPAYNEEENLPELYKRLSHVLAKLESEYQFECLLIDNGSHDQTERIALEFTKKDNRWKYIRFSRNFSIVASLTAAVFYAKGVALVYLFSDLQDPPEAIPEMLEKWRQGYDVVYGVVRERHDSGLLKTVGARLFYRLLFWCSELKIPANATDFRLISRPVMEALKGCGERVRYMRGLIFWTGFRQTSFVYDRSPRKRGRSTADVLFCFRFAITAITIFSSKPLHIMSVLGMVMMLLGFFGASAYSVFYFLHSFHLIGVFNPPSPGWTTMILIILFLGGMQFLFLGLLGEYIGNAYTELKNRPLWIVEKTAGFKENDPVGDYEVRQPSVICSSRVI